MGGTFQISDRVKLQRDVEAIEIPCGDKHVLPAGSEVRITQALGGTYTVMTERGLLVRIDGKDAEALGREAAPGPSAAAEDTPLEKLVWDQLRTCYDPEIPVNIVDLGLVYECKVSAIPEGGHKVYVQLTLTAPGCGMGNVLKADAESKLRALPGVTKVEVDLVVDPPWTQDMMTEAARLQLGLF